MDRWSVDINLVACIEQKNRITPRWNVSELFSKRPKIKPYTAAGGGGGDTGRMVVGNAVHSRRKRELITFENETVETDP